MALGGLIMRLTINKYNPLTIAICIMIMLNIAAHYMRFLMEDGAVITRMDQICWMVLFLFWAFTNTKNRIKISAKECVLFIIIVFSTILGWLIGSEIYPEVKGYFVQMLFFIISFALCVCMKWPKRLGIKDVSLIMKLINVCCMIAVAYGMIFQNDLILRVLMNNNAAKASWNYVSFFTQRNIFATLCFIGVICSLYLYESGQLKRYVLLGILYLFNIFITDSQTSLYSTLFFIAIFMFFKSRHKIFLFFSVLIGGVGILMSFSASGLMSVFSGHMTSYGVDSGTLRFRMWMQGFEQLTEHKSWLLGLGEGANNCFLRSIYSYGSFHNAYVDILFQGGLIRITCYLYVAIVCWSKIRKVKNKAYRNVMMAAYLAFALYSCFEASAMFFELNYYGVLASILFVIIPLNISSSE